MGDTAETQDQMKVALWWHLAYLGVAGIITVILLIDPDTESYRALALGVTWSVVAMWFLWGRLSFQKPLAAVLWQLVMLTALGAGIALNPSMGFLQALVYPIIWVLAPSTRVAVLVNCLAASVAFTGFFVVYGATLEAAIPALVIAGLSLIFSLVMGNWIATFADQADERGRLLRELRLNQDKLAEVSHQAGILAERERLAAELHDTIAQTLTALVMLAERAEREQPQPESQKKTLQLLQEHSRSALNEARALVAAAAPVELNDGGLCDALRRLADRFSRETAVAVTVSNVSALTGFSREHEVVLLRFAQEALANIRKHSNADRAELRALNDEDRVVLEVADNGTGLPDNLAGITDRGFGLSGLSKRLQTVSGQLDIGRDSALGGMLLRASFQQEPAVAAEPGEKRGSAQ